MDIDVWAHTAAGAGADFELTAAMTPAKILPGRVRPRFDAQIIRKSQGCYQSREAREYIRGTVRNLRK